MAQVQTATIVRALPAPLRLGAMTVTRREYAAARIRLADAEGIAYCLTREAPVTQIVDRLLAPQLEGSDIDPGEAWDAMYRGSAIVGRVGLVRRAMGLVDIAYWDAWTRSLGLPLWRALGRDDSPREAMLVAAYPSPDVPVEQTIEEVLRGAAEGWPLVKISRTPDNAAMRSVIRGITDGLPAGTRLVVDVGFGWRDADEAMSDLRQWGDLDLAWLEDPLVPEDVAGCARLRQQFGQRIAVGDEVTDPRVLQSLVSEGGVDVLRLDVVAIGGITPAIELVDWAAEQGVEVSCHVYPEVSVHLGVGVETFDRAPGGNPYDPAPGLVVTDAEFRSGYVRPPAGPGLGFAFTEDPFSQEVTS